MLLNTWLAAAKRRLFGSSAAHRNSSRRTSPSSSTAGEVLENRSLLTALVINAQNVDDFVDPATGNLAVTNATLGGADELVIESVSLTAFNEAISIDLNNMALKSLAIDTVTVGGFAGTAIDVNLTNVTGLETIAVEDVTVSDNGTGVTLNLVNTDAEAVTVEDSVLPGVNVTASAGSIIGNGVITQNTINTPANVEGVVLTIDSGADADNFHIIDNYQIQSLNRDAILINLTDADTDGLRIANNVIGNEPGADVLFRATGDTFVQPFQLTNNGHNGELLTQFQLDLTSLGLVFDTGADGKPFTIVNGGGSPIVAAENLSSNNQILTVDFTGFTTGETFEFVIDIDRAANPITDPPIPTPIFGNDLIGAGVNFEFDDGAKVVAGQMIGDVDIFNGSLFALDAGAALDIHGINFNLSNAPVTNAEITNNTITGVSGHGLIFDAAAQSDITALIDGNTITSSGQDGIRFDLVDSNFTGAIEGNSIGAGNGHGIFFNPRVARSGNVDAAFDGSPISITSPSHGLQTGDQIMIQGMTNANPSIVHPGNGLHTVTRTGNDTFTLNGTTGLVPGVSYKAGGSWYVPDFDLVTGEAQGLVTIDLMATQPEGRITAIQNPSGGGDVELTSVGHGLSTGDRVRVEGSNDTQLDGEFSITVINADTFSLDTENAVGAYDTSSGLASWQSNLITDVTNPVSGEVVVTSAGHGLQTGDQVRIADVLGNTAANGTHTITRLSADAFALQGVSGNGNYVPQTGFWTPIAETTFTGDAIAQRISGNTITGNGAAGIYVDLATGTTFDGDIVNNVISDNEQKGIHIESHSYGVGETLPLDPNDPLALPGAQDISFDVNIGSDVANVGADGFFLDGNYLNRNGHAGIVIEAFNLATGSFEIQGNVITNTIDDGDSATGWAGDGIYVALESDGNQGTLQAEVDSSSLLIESVVENNTIGVDGQGNDGHGLNFLLTDRARIQDLEVVRNFFVNNALDGFHFVRTENGSLNAVLLDNNDVTNNEGDGFDLFAENSVDDRLDFRIFRNDINNNGEYGVRIDVEASARIEVDFDTNDVIGNGRNGNGFHPDDSNPATDPNDPTTAFAGNAGAAGGVGLFAFEEVEVVFRSVNSRIVDNIGDGFSVDTIDSTDTLRMVGSFIDTEFSNNTLTGFRAQGASFANYEIISSLLNQNGEDGLRIVSVQDKVLDPRLQVRVAGADIDLTGIGNQFSGNGSNGAVLGQGVSATFGTGVKTAEFANIFDNNGADGLKIVQDVGPYLASIGRRRSIETDGNFFRGNGSAGVDIGHDVTLEGGHVEHGYEVASDVDVVINDAIISHNAGDGVEYLADSKQRIEAAVGSQQDIPTTDISSLAVSNSRIEGNGQRGVDILNRMSEDSRVSLINNEILTNTFSGIYVINTAAHFQTQFGPGDELYAALDNRAVTENAAQGLEAARSVEPLSAWRTPNIELRVQGNNILDNGNQNSNSTITLPFSSSGEDSEGVRHPDWWHDYGVVSGTLGGLVIRAGSVDTVGRDLTFANPVRELGESGIDAEVVGNTFNGNFGSGVYIDQFVSGVPEQSQGRFQTDENDNIFLWSQGARDPLARIDLVFRENSGNSLDVMNGFAFFDNDEHYFKSRHIGPVNSPPHDHVHVPSTNPPGDAHLGTRARNLTRTTSTRDHIMGALPLDFDVNPIDIQLWAFDGYGTPTLRVEPDYDFDQFTQTSTIQGFSTFEDTVALPNSVSTTSPTGTVEYQWDTGRNVTGFVGQTPFSLSRGSVFNVRPGEDPIQADGLEENDSFVGAYPIGLVAGNNFSVNALTNSSLQPGILNIERKGDRDYYRFRTAEAFHPADNGQLDVNLSVNDTLGDAVQFMVYEVQPLTDTEEVPLLHQNLIPQFRTAPPGGANTITDFVKPDTEYIIEVFSSEASNLGVAAGGLQTNFVYGTTRSYSLDIDAPVAAPPVQASSSGSQGSQTVVTSSGSGSVAAASVADEAPIVEDISDIANRNVSLDSLTVRFSEDVTNVDVTDFVLTRDGNVLDLSAVVVTEIDSETYQLTHLAPLTSESGAYEFRVDVAGSDIVDSDDEPLKSGGNDVETWVLDNSVNSFTDGADIIPGDGQVSDSSGNRTLRAAVMEANANVGIDVITLNPGIHMLTLGGIFEDGAAEGDLDVHESLTIRGAGATALDTVIDGGGIDRIFHAFPGVTLTLENVTLQNGAAYDGGGILVEGTAPNTSAAHVNLTDVNIIDSTAYNQGGGIYNLGTVTSERSSISRNSAGSRGGGIFNHGVVELTNSTVSTNTAVSRGGGIYNEIEASAVNGNLMPVQAAATIYSLNSTIAFNAAGSRGGGIYQESGNTITFGNTIIDQNTAAGNPDFSNTVQSLGHNFIGQLDLDPADAGVEPSDINANLTAGVTNSGVLPLATAPDSNGTWHNPPADTAFVVDAGSDDLYATETGIPVENVNAAHDQTGRTRQVEGNEDAVFRIDIGAAEYFINMPVAIFSATPNPAGVNETVSFDASASTHTLLPGDSKLVSYDWDFSYDGVTFNVEGTGLTPTTSYSMLNTYTVALRITDDNGFEDIAVTNLVVGAPTPPTILYPNQTADANFTISWDAGTGTFSVLVTQESTGNVIVNVSDLTETSYTLPAAVDPGEYTVIVTASNQSGIASSLPHTVQLVDFELISPTHNSVEWNKDTEFIFPSIADAVNYEIWIQEQDPQDRDRTLGLRLHNEFISAALADQGDGTAKYVAQDLGEGVFNVWMRPLENGGNRGFWSTGVQYEIGRPVVTGPPAATLLSQPTLTWEQLGNAPFYGVELYQQSGILADGSPLFGPKLVFEQDNISGTSIQVPTNLGNGNFRLFVYAHNAAGQRSEWSLPYDFKRDLFNGPELISPILNNFETNPFPEFQLQPIDGVDHYRIVLFNADTNERIFDTSSVEHDPTASVISYVNAEEKIRAGNYEWWAAGVLADGTSTTFSGPGQFRVPRPVGVSPVGPIEDVMPEFTWTGEGIEEFVSFEIWVNNLTTNSPGVIQASGITTTSFTNDLPLENGRFEWFVRGIDADNNPSDWSEGLIFTLTASVGTATRITDVFGNPPTFIWTEVNNAVEYEILVTTLSVANQPVVYNQVTTGTPFGFFSRFQTATSSFFAGEFRVWIRGIEADQTAQPWSQPFQFTITQLEEDQADDSLLAMDSRSVTQDFQSIIVHPAKTVATWIPTVLPTAEVTQSEDVESQEAVLPQAVPQETLDSVDAIMEELATDGIFDVDLESGEPAISEEAATVTASEGSNDRQASASLLGLGLAALTGRRRRRNRNRD